MQKKNQKQVAPPKFSNEQQEAAWWASSNGRDFLKAQPAPGPKKPAIGSRLVSKLSKASSVQIALRLPSPDLAKAREIAERKGIGYQTLLKMIVHEGLLRVDRQTTRASGPKPAPPYTS